MLDLGPTSRKFLTEFRFLFFSQDLEWLLAESWFIRCCLHSRHEIVTWSKLVTWRLTQHHNGGSKYSYTSLRLNTRKARIIFLADTFSRDFAPEVNVSEFFHELKKIDHVVSLPSVTYDGIKLKVHQWSILSSKNYGRLYSAKPCCRSQTAHWSPAVTWIPIS